jgi:acyl phosphate:glycerol-3-phosphate acyltransferase
MHYVLIALSFVPFYLIGVFPTGYLIAKHAGVDIFKHGSGNVGATNIGRVIGKKAGLLTLVIDIGKGALAVGIAAACGLGVWYTSLAALAVILGHCISLPPLLKGGKGVATALGALLVLAPIVALGAALIFAAVFYWKRIVSLSSVSAAFGAPIVALLCGLDDQIFYGLVPIAITVVLRHKENLKRLALGTEPIMQFRKN